MFFPITYQEALDRVRKMPSIAPYLSEQDWADIHTYYDHQPEAFLRDINILCFYVETRISARQLMQTEKGKKEIQAKIASAQCLPLPELIPFTQPLRLNLTHLAQIHGIDNGPSLVVSRSQLKVARYIKQRLTANPSVIIACESWYSPARREDIDPYYRKRASQAFGPNFPDGLKTAELSKQQQELLAERGAVGIMLDLGILPEIQHTEAPPTESFMLKLSLPSLIPIGEGGLAEMFQAAMGDREAWALRLVINTAAARHTAEQEVVIAYGASHFLDFAIERERLAIQAAAKHLTIKFHRVETILDTNKLGDPRYKPESCTPLYGTHANQTSFYFGSTTAANFEDPAVSPEMQHQPASASASDALVWRGLGQETQIPALTLPEATQAPASQVLAFSAIPLFVAIAVLILSYFAYNRSKPRRQKAYYEQATNG